MSRFLLKLVLLLPLLLGMAWVNWSVDPAILFVEHQADPSRHPYENLVARDLLAGRPHRLKTGCSEFLLDELVFRGRPQIDTLVLGTSIAKPIHEGLFGSPQFWNASVTGGRIEEMIVAYQLALDCGLHPRHALIEIDGRSLGQRAHVPPSKVLRKAFRRLGLPDETQSESIWKRAWDAIVPGREAAGPANEHGPFYPYDELVSPRYFQFTVACLARQWWAPAKRSQEPASQFGEANEALIYPDGSLDWWNNALAQTPETIRQKFDELHTTAIADEAYRPVPLKCGLYEAFVTDLVRAGVEVEFVLLPPNPWYYERAEEEWKRAGKPLPSLETEAAIRSMAAKYKLPVRGSLDPHRVGVTEADYIDDVHLRREAVERIFKMAASNRAG
jgi:hypothetical protein